MKTQTTDFSSWLGEALTVFEPFLVAECQSRLRGTPPALAEAIEAGLLSGGKRIRPALVLLGCEASGSDSRAALPAACAVEMMHAYSLVHDDLPSMDDDLLRRGQPTVHARFGEATAILAGDALQAMAFGVLASQTNASMASSQASLLAEAVGPSGMVGGQFLDMENRGRTPLPGEVEAIHLGKTAALMAASLKIGVLAAAGNPDPWDVFACTLGLLFQATDDILDATALSEDLGKPTGRDKEEGKATLVACEGLEGAVKKATCLADEAARSLVSIQPSHRKVVLEDLTTHLLQRCR